MRNLSEKHPNLTLIQQQIENIVNDEQFFTDKMELIKSQLKLSLVSYLGRFGFVSRYSPHIMTYKEVRLHQSSLCLFNLPVVKGNMLVFHCFDSDCKYKLEVEKLGGEFFVRDLLDLSCHTCTFVHDEKTLLSLISYDTYENQKPLEADFSDLHQDLKDSYQNYMKFENKCLHNFYLALELV